MSCLQQSLDVVTIAHDETAIASIDQRCSSEQQAIIGDGKTEIVRPRLAKAPDVMDVSEFAAAVRGFTVLGDNEPGAASSM